MTIDGIRGINAGFIRTLGALSKERESFSPLGGSSTVSLSGSLRIGARLFADSVGHLNDLISFTNISREKLGELSDVVDKLYNLAERASRAGTGSQARSQLNRQFNRLAKDFEKIIKDAEVGGANLLTKGGLAELFTRVGLDTESSAKLAALFDQFKTVKGDDRLASSEIRNTSRMSMPSVVTPPVVTSHIALTEITADFDQAFAFDGGALFVKNNSVYSIDSSGTESLIFDGSGLEYGDIKIKAVSKQGEFVLETRNDLDGSFQFSMFGDGDDDEDDDGEVPEIGLASQLYMFRNDGIMAGRLTDAMLTSEGHSVEYSSVAITGNGVFFLSESRELKDGEIHVTQLLNYSATATEVAEPLIEISYSYGEGDPEPQKISSVQFSESGDRFLLMYQEEDYIFLTLSTFPEMEEDQSFLEQLAIKFDDPDQVKGFTLLDNGTVLVHADYGSRDALLYYSEELDELMYIFDSSEDYRFDNVYTDGSGYIAFTELNSGMIKLYQLGEGAPILIDEYQAPSSPHKLHFTQPGNPPGLLVETMDDSRTLNKFARVETVEPGSTVRLSLTNSELTSRIFSSSLTLENRGHAIKIAHDLKELKKQISSNIDNLDEATKLIEKSLEAARQAGFAFLELSDSLQTVSDAESLAEMIRNRLRQKGGALAGGGFDLESLAVAAYALSKVSEK